MNNMDNEKLQYWIVKLGELFYTGGLPRLSKEDEDVKGYDFANKEEVAFPIMLEEIARDIASEVGGIAIPKEGIVKNVGILKEKNDFYLSSANLWEKQQLENFKEQLKSEIEEN